MIVRTTSDGYIQHMNPSDTISFLFYLLTFLPYMLYSKLFMDFFDFFIHFTENHRPALRFFPSPLT